MSEQQEVTEEQFILGQRMESLARQNAQQAIRIADLEARIALMQAKAQQESASESDEPLAGELPLDSEEEDAKH